MASGVKGVGCGIRGLCRRLLFREMAWIRRAPESPYFREVSTRKRPAANPAFDLAPLAGSGLYLSASASSFDWQRTGGSRGWFDVRRADRRYSL